MTAKAGDLVAMVANSKTILIATDQSQVISHKEGAEAISKTSSLTTVLSFNLNLSSNAVKMLEVDSKCSTNRSQETNSTKPKSHLRQSS